MDALLNTAPCGFLTFADDGAVQLVNATLLEMLGYEREEIVGRHVEQILTVGSRIFYQTHWFPLLRVRGGAEEIFLMLRTKSGEDLGVLVNARRRDTDGKAAYDCVLMRVRERQKYEDELLRARRAAEHAQAELEVQARDLRFANEQLESQAVELELQQQQLEEQSVILEEASEELRVTNEDLQDRIEEAEHLREVADAANKAKSTFLAVMSHELRTPLNAIGGYVQLMEMGIHGPVTGEQLEALNRIGRGQAHLLRLINDVLNLARIEAGHIEYSLEDVSVSEMLDAITPMIEPQLGAKELTFAMDVPAGLIVRVDREKVQQVLLNLLGNSVKFTPEGGHITVDAIPAGSDEEQVLVRVRDSGIGIPPEKLDSIFEPFVRVEEGRQRGAEGSGLGLAISRDLARGMGGDLAAESAPGQGSTFTLSLPLAPGAPVT